MHHGSTATRQSSRHGAHHRSLPSCLALPAPCTQAVFPQPGSAGPLSPAPRRTREVKCNQQKSSTLSPWRVPSRQNGGSEAAGLGLQLRGNHQTRCPCRESATLKVWHVLPSSADFLSIQSFSSLSRPRGLAPRGPNRCCALSQESLDTAAVGQKAADAHRNMARTSDSKHCVLWQRSSRVQPSLPPGRVSQEQSRMEQEKQHSQTSDHLTCFESCTFSVVVITPLQ